MRELFIGNIDEAIMYIVLNDGSCREVYYEKYTDKHYINGKKSKYDTTNKKIPPKQTSDVVCNVPIQAH